MRPTITTLSVLSAAALAALTGCGDGERSAACPMGASDAIAVLAPTQGSQVHGTVRFTQTADGVKIVADIAGLEPNSKHAIHVHEFGDVSAPDGMSAGTHFNPEKHVHGGPASAEHHAGDLGNLTADATGAAHYELTAPWLSVCCGKDPVLGHSVIVHAKEDDLLPTANPGQRVAQGVIGIAKPAAPTAK
jgi:Cu-Zn family superoxide dismutase